MKALAIIDIDESYELEEDYTVADAIKEGRLDIAYDIVYERKEIGVLGGLTIELKPMPEIKNIRDYRDKIVGDYKLQIRIADFISGYNSCIDEILGGNE